MPQINIRPAVAADIPLLVELDHDYVTDYVWQMDVQRPEEGQINIGFRQVRLPRSARVEYPRPVRALRENWQSRSGLLVARLQDQVVGYISLSKEIAPAHHLGDRPGHHAPRAPPGDRRRADLRCSRMGAGLQHPPPGAGYAAQKLSRHLPGAKTGF